jgi:DNA invertase Pin-like site-specific DNA recombinase
MKAIIFARVSSREQEETGYSLASQERLLTQYAKEKGFEIEKIFDLRIRKRPCATPHVQ